VQPPEPPPPPDPVALRARRKRRVISVAAAVAVVLSVPAGIAIRSATRTSPYPSTWDRRVQPIVDVVEEERGLDFDHPVEIEFLPEKEFEERVLDVSAARVHRAGDAERDAGLAELKRETDQLVALGLLAGDVDDVFRASDQLTGSSALAFYDPASEGIVVRGTRLDLPTRVTVAHELTHALQDQHFDLDALVADAPADGADPVRALVEGDATRIEEAYLATLSPAAQAEVEQATDTDIADLEAEIGGKVPEILQVAMAAPYVLGHTFAAIIALDGPEAADAAFEAPPTTDEHIMNSSTYLDGDEPVDDVVTPSLPQGARQANPGETWGAISWYLTLASRIDPATALVAADGWGGDKVVGFRQDGAPCARLTFQGDTDADTAEMASALDQWVTAMPAGAAHADYQGGQVALTSCATDAVQPPEAGVVMGAFTVLAARAGIILAIADEVYDLGVVECAGNTLSADPINNGILIAGVEPSPAELEAFRERVAVAIRDCR